MIHRLKREKNLSNTTLRQFLVPALQHLDLDGVYITEGTLKVIGTKCSNLTVLSLKDCGYVVTDTALDRLIKRLPLLESLSLCACKHVTDRALKTLLKHCKRLKQLNLTWIRTISERALIDFVCNCESLEFLDIYDHCISKDGVAMLTELGIKHSVTIVHKDLNHTKVAPVDPCAFLPLFGKTLH